MTKSDHDILIKVETNINNLCKKVDGLNDKFDKREDDCDKCKDNIYKTIGEVKNSSIQLSLFKWIIGGFCVTIIIIIGYLVIAGTNITKNTTNIDHIKTTIFKTS